MPGVGADLASRDPGGRAFRSTPAGFRWSAPGLGPSLWLRTVPVVEAGERLFSPAAAWQIIFLKNPFLCQVFAGQRI